MSETPKAYTSTSVGEATDEILFGELVRRGYNPAEMVNKHGY